MPMPAALRKYWATHGRKGGGSKAPATRAPPRATSYTRRAKDWFKQSFPSVKPLEMLLLGGAGYYLGPLLNTLGLPWAVYKQFPGSYGKVIDTLYAAANESGVAPNMNPWSYGGTGGLLGLAGVGLVGKTIYDTSKAGHVPSRDMNAYLPLALGMIAATTLSKAPGAGSADATLYW